MRIDTTSVVLRELNILKIKYIQMSVYISVYMHWGMSQMLCANFTKI